MQKVDRLGWAAGVCFQAYGWKVGVRVNKPEALERVLPCLPPGWEPAEIAVAVGRELGRPTDESVVRLALEQLSRRNLLLTPVAPAAEAVRLKRRAFLKGLVKAGAVAAAVPVIMTILVPGKAAAASNQPAQTNNNTPFPCRQGASCFGPSDCGGTGQCVPAMNFNPPGGGPPQQSFPGNCSC